MQIFLDESGDLGWSFEKPNQNGGSSRFITIAGVVIHADHLKYLNRYISELYKKYNLTPKQEKKGASFSNEDACYIVNNFNRVTSKSSSFKVISITAKKEKVFEQLRRDPNIFYNYMLGLLLPDTIKQHEKIKLILDRRTIKIQSGNSFEDYIKTKCWGDLKIKTEIDCEYDSSDRNEGIWIADWMANFIWRNYENSFSDPYNQLVKKLPNSFFEKTLYNH